MLAEQPPGAGQANDIDFLMALGEIFTGIVYAQLLLENARIYAIDADLVEQIFDVLVRDFSHFALALHNKASSTPAQMEHCLGMLHKPHRDEERYQRVWEGHVLPQADRYAMNP